jgi:hypothetical protein
MLAGRHMNGGGGRMFFFFKKKRLSDWVQLEECSWTMQQRPVHDRTALSRRMVYSTSFVAFSTSAATATAYGQENPGQRPDDAHRDGDSPLSQRGHATDANHSASALLHFTECPSKFKACEWMIHSCA